METGVFAYDRRGRLVGPMHSEVFASDAVTETRVAIGRRGSFAIYSAESREIAQVQLTESAVDSLEWLADDLLHVTRRVRGSSGAAARVHSLYRAPFDRPIFEVDGEAVFTRGGELAYTCDGYQLSRVDVNANQAVALGPCEGDTLQPSPDGRFVAIPFGSETHVVRDDGARMVLSGVIESLHPVAYVHDPVTGRFALFGDAEHLGVVAYREAGPLLEASMSTAAAASARDDSIWASFLSAPAAAPAEAEAAE